MSVSKTRAYQRALALYQARTGVAPVDSTRNIIQDIVQAILEEVADHFKTLASQTVTGTITVAGSGTSPATTYNLQNGKTTTAGDIGQTT